MTKSEKARAGSGRSASFPTSSRTLIRVGLLASLALVVGCGGESDAQGGEPSFRVLSPTVSSAPEAAPALPEPIVWEAPLDDPLLERGRLVWKGTCIQCHSTGLGGAPLIGNRDLWGPRLEKGIEVLTAHALEGFYGDVGEMPARGGNNVLTDDEVRAAVRFMTSRARDSI